MPVANVPHAAVTSSENVMARMRERLGGGLRPPTRLDGRRVRRRGGDEVDIDDPRGGP